MVKHEYWRMLTKLLLENFQYMRPIWEGIEIVGQSLLCSFKYSMVVAAALIFFNRQWFTTGYFDTNCVWILLIR